jgi:hypothetical protein
MDKVIMSKFRWNPYAFLEDNELDAMFEKHFDSNSKILLILGKGFDVRMNIFLKRLVDQKGNQNITCLLVNFDEGRHSSSHQYKHLVDENQAELETLIPKSQITNFAIQLWKQTGRKSRRVGDRKAANIIDEISVENYSDIIVDISALPRGVYFSLLGKLLTYIDRLPKGTIVPNLMVAVAENPELDMNIQEEGVDDDLNFLHGFGGEIDLSSSEGTAPLIWLPILGEDKLLHLQKAYSHLKPGEICPILPFPSRDPRRPDSLTMTYHELLFDELRIEPQNIMYVPEQNPFEAYKILYNTIENYNISLKTLNGCKAVLSTFSSKLLSIGTLLAAYELKEKDIGVGVLNVDSHGYKINPSADLKRLKLESKLFVTWLTGKPYSL